MRIARIKAVARERVYRRSLIGQRSPVLAVFDSTYQWKRLAGITFCDRTAR